MAYRVFQIVEMHVEEPKRGKTSRSFGVNVEEFTAIATKGYTCGTILHHMDNMCVDGGGCRNVVT